MREPELELKLKLKLESPQVKICGLMLPETAKQMQEAGADVDYIGFVFAPSKRRIDAARAKEIAQAFGGGTAPVPRFVGVFVNPEPEELDAIVKAVPLDAVQLHGDETAEYCREVKRRHPRVEVWKALGVSGDSLHGETAAADRLGPYEGAVDTVLLDAWDPKTIGGTGTTFRWEAIPAYQYWCDSNGVRLIVAGGLNSGNVGDLLDAYAVGAVDVSSGVETDGVKDIEKIRTFTERVKGR
ncbi:phosphoribosylanthranilate isomerase [Paenibacillus thermotolerans]|uniref:phosphoribosylanthranilate isomerase n=1 Tax=Paenibacillus thermotolerans TaxID=3027807 RepID=UPI0023681475|nr:MULTISPECIES: phosphoribosylanthranilate isomerase [unclassified Paenibacillus]